MGVARLILQLQKIFKNLKLQKNISVGVHFLRFFDISHGFRVRNFNHHLAVHSLLVVHDQVRKKLARFLRWISWKTSFFDILILKTSYVIFHMNYLCSQDFWRYHMPLYTSKMDDFKSFAYDFSARL